jgi:hypothetical protein
MITCVRIAPVERWCEDMLKSAERHPGLLESMVGKQLKIIPESIAIGVNTSCGGREWMVDSKDAVRIRNAAGILTEKGVNYWVCEHTLEID